MAKRVYLVDTENVGSIWVKILEILKEHDELLLFYTDNSPAVSYQDLQKVLGFTDRFEFIHCYAGRNGLDFQLVTYLGYLVNSTPDAEYVVVSNDMGFDTVVKFWTERELRVIRLNAARINAEYNKIKFPQVRVESISSVIIRDTEEALGESVSDQNVLRENIISEVAAVTVPSAVELKIELVNEAAEADDDTGLEPLEIPLAVAADSEAMKETDPVEVSSETASAKPRRRGRRKAVVTVAEPKAEEKAEVKPSTEESLTADEKTESLLNSELSEKAEEKSEVQKPERKPRGRKPKAAVLEEKTEKTEASETPKKVRSSKSQSKQEKPKKDSTKKDGQAPVQVAVDENDSPRTYLDKCLKDVLTIEEIEWMFTMLNEFKLPEAGLNKIYNEIIKHFAQEKGLKVYKTLRPSLGHFTELLKFN